MNVGEKFKNISNLYPIVIKEHADIQMSILRLLRNSRIVLTSSNNFFSRTTILKNKSKTLSNVCFGVKDGLNQPTWVSEDNYVLNGDEKKIWINKHKLPQ